jgi:ribonuclease HI
MEATTIYTDGASLPSNPGPSGSSAVILIGNKRTELSSSYRWSTNNRAEIRGAILALQSLEGPSRGSIVTDSQYLAHTVNRGWLKRWVRQKFVKKKGLRLNHDLWRELDELLSRHQFTFRWVRGHGKDRSRDTVENNRCDYLAERAATHLRSPTLCDEEYERLSGFKPKLKPQPRIEQPFRLSQGAHEEIIRSELVWSDAELGID